LSNYEDFETAAISTSQKRFTETPFLLKSNSFEQNMQKQHKNSLSIQSSTSQIQQIHGTYKLK